MYFWKRILPLFLLLVLLCSCGNKGQKAVGSCAGYDVSFDELRYIVLSCKEEMADTYGKDIWNTQDSAEQYRAELEDRVGQAFFETYGVLAACADYLPGLSPDSEELADEIKSNIEAAKKSYGSKSEYLKSLNENYLTEQLVKKLLGVTLMQMKLEDKLVPGQFTESQTALMDYLDQGNYCKVQKVTITAEQATAEAYYNAPDFQNPPDFVTLDSAEYFFRGLGDASVESDVFSLSEVGAVSPLRTFDGGVFFYVRVQADRDVILNYQLPTLLSKYRAMQMAEVLERYRANTVLQLTEEIDFLSITE